jgi:hypothetical protein
MASKIQIRRDTAANWTATNPTLAQGEPGLETDSNLVKYGDGTTAWVDLDYASGGGITNGNLDVSRPQQGWAATISPVNTGYGMIYHDATVLHSGNLYLAGGFYSSFASDDDGFNQDAMVVSKISTDGEVLASKMIWESGQSWAYCDSVTVNPTTGNIIIGGSQYRGGGKFHRHEINANLTAITSTQYSFLGGAWAYVVGSDLMPDGNTITYGGHWGGDQIVYSNVTPHPGSYTHYLGVNIAATFGSNTLPSLQNGWSITGYSISGSTSITNINLFFANESSSTSADGYGSNWDITYTPGSNVYVVSDYYGGVQYATGDVVTIHGNELGGNITTNDLTITVGNVNGSGSILDWTLSGVAQTELIWFYENSGIDFSTLPSGEQWNIQQSTSDNAWLITDDWARTIGGSSWDYPRSITTDIGGNVYITMEADSGSDTRDGTKAGVVKLNSSGVHQWTKFVDFGQYNNPQGIAVDSTGNVIVSVKTNNGYGTVSKLNPTTGDIYWRTTIGTDGDYTDMMGFQDLTNPVVDSTGNIIVAGEFNSITSDGDDILVMSFNSNTGAVNWQRAISNVGDQNISWDNGHKTLVCDGDNYYVTYFTSTGNDQSTTVKLPVDGTTPGMLAGTLQYQEQEWIVYTETAPTAVNDTGGFIEVTDMLVTTTNQTTSLVDLINNEYVSTATTTLGLGATGYVKGVTTLEFEDGTSISTAPQSAQSEFVGNNYATMRIEVYNGGKNLYWDGNTDVEWFNSYNAPGAGQGWQVTGAIIEYQLYDDQNYGTQIGTIHCSGFYDNAGEATHTEHYTSDRSDMQYNQPWIFNSNSYNQVRLMYRGEIGTSHDVKIQWTARVFYGQENNC